jgi:hypothetical protein
MLQIEKRVSGFIAFLLMSNALRRSFVSFRRSLRNLFKAMADCQSPPAPAWQLAGRISQKASRKASLL